MTKVRRGYTKEGYPIVWLRKLSHEQCLAKLKQESAQMGEPVELDSSVTIKKGKVAGMRFRVFSTDTYNITLDIDGHKTFHSKLADVAVALRRAIERKKVRDHGETGITELSELVDTFVEAQKEFEECWK